MAAVAFLIASLALQEAKAQPVSRETAPQSREEKTAMHPRVVADLQSFDESVSKMEREFDPGPADPRNKEWIKKKLALMTRVDQFMRNHVEMPFQHKYSKSEEEYFWSQFGPRWQKIDSNNTAALKELLKAHVWFKISEFGVEADDNAWLLVQHADQDVPFQKQVLPILEKLYPIGETNSRNYAYLYDRVATAEKRPQRFATQGRCISPGRWEPFTSEDPGSLEQRRKAMGLSSLEENRLRLNKVCH
jgi:hypothetical protein